MSSAGVRAGPQRKRSVYALADIEERKAGTAVAEGASLGESNGSSAPAPPPPPKPPPPPAGGMRILDLPVTPELTAISLVYFVQGILGLSRLAVSFYFKDDLGLDPAQLAVYTGFTSLPWLVKPLYGFASDTFPLFGYRRRSYLVACGLLGSAAWSALFVLHPGVLLATALLVAGSAGTACSDVVVDSIVVEASRGQPSSVAGSYQSLSWGSAALGGIVSAYFSGSLIEEYGVSFVFGVTAVFPLLVVAAALLINEQRIVAAPRAAESLTGGDGGGGGGGLAASTAALRADVTAQAKRLWGAIRQPDIFYPALFVFFWQATPSADSAMFYFYSNELHFGPEFLGRVRLVGSVSSLAGIWLYNSYFKKVPLRTMFLWSAILGTTLSLTQVLLVTGANQSLGISNEWFTIADEIVLTVLGRVSFMPVLVLAARVCPEGVEATLFATLMSILNGGSVTGSFAGSLMTDALGVTATNFGNLAPLVTICALGTLLPLPLLTLVPRSLDEDPEEDEGKDS